jgi:hypothetical protein
MDQASGAELIERLQRTLGIAILVQSVEPADVAARAADPSVEGVTILATFLFGSNTTDVAVTGDSEREAWDALARAAIAWRNADFQSIQMWPGGG